MSKTNFFTAYVAEISIIGGDFIITGKKIQYFWTRLITLDWPYRLVGKYLFLSIAEINKNLQFLSNSTVYTSL